MDYRLNPNVPLTQALRAATTRHGVVAGTVVFLFALVRILTH